MAVYIALGADQPCLHVNTMSTTIGDVRVVARTLLSRSVPKTNPAREPRFLAESEPKLAPIKLLIEGNLSPVISNPIPSASSYVTGSSLPLSGARKTH